MFDPIVFVGRYEVHYRSRSTGEVYVVKHTAYIK